MMRKKIVRLLLISLIVPFLSLPGSGNEMDMIKGSINGIPYMTGGVGKVERSDMIKMYKDYNLKIILALNSGDYLALLPVSIYDSSGNNLLQTEVSGPWLYVKLPEGDYIIQASYKGKVKKRNAYVANMGLGLVMFNWKKA